MNVRVLITSPLDTGKKPPVHVAQTRSRFEPRADAHPSKIPHALLKHARSKASVGCGDKPNGVSAARQHLVIAAMRGDQASFQRTALEHGRVSGCCCCRVATQPCGRGFYYVRQIATREREKYILPGFGLTRNWFSLVKLWNDKASHR